MRAIACLGAYSRVLVLSGGRGARLHSLPSSLAKQLVPVGNRLALGYYVLSKVAEVDARDVGVVIALDNGRAVREHASSGGEWRFYDEFIVQKLPWIWPSG